MRWVAMVVIAGCGLPANRASGTFAGRPWHGAVLDAEYCEHCGGGPEFTLAFSPPVAPGKYAEDGVFIEESSVVEPGMKPQKVRLDPSWDRMRIKHGLSRSPSDD